MKTILSALLLFFLSNTSRSQCTENAFAFGNNERTPSYNISGDVSVTLNTDNTITIDLAANFSTAYGPDVRAYLINSEGRSLETLRETEIENLENIEFGVISQSGAQTFTVSIPENAAITNFDKVFFYCLEFGAFWDVGAINPFSGSSCSVLSTHTFDTTSLFTIYPNPTTSSIAFTNIDVTNAEIHIFDYQGKSVLVKKQSIHNQMDVSSLSSGIYFIVIQKNQRTLSKKLIIQ